MLGAALRVLRARFKGHATRSGARWCGRVHGKAGAHLVLAITDAAVAAASSTLGGLISSGAAMPCSCWSRRIAAAVVLPHRCAAFRAGCGRCSSMLSSLHACAAHRTDTRHRQQLTGQRSSASCPMAPLPHVPEPFGRAGTSLAAKKMMVDLRRARLAGAAAPPLNPMSMALRYPRPRKGLS